MEKGIVAHDRIYKNYSNGSITMRTGATFFSRFPGRAIKKKKYPLTNAE
jgi:hypothetical protein